MSRGTEGRIFLEKTRIGVNKKLLSPAKLYQEIWKWNFIQNLMNHSLTNRGYLYCAIFEAFKAKYIQIFLQNVQYKDNFNMKFNRAASLFNSQVPHPWYSYFVTIVRHYYGATIECFLHCGTPLIEVA